MVVPSSRVVVKVATLAQLLPLAKESLTVKWNFLTMAIAVSQKFAMPSLP